jgi:hypothetical protein
MSALLLLLLATANDDTYEAARRAFEEGVAAMDAGRTDDAIGSFERSLALRESEAALFNLGMACRVRKRHVCVVKALARYLELAPEDSPGRPEAESTLESERAFVGSVRLRVGGEVETVTIDGTPIARGAGELVVEPGPHTFAAARGAVRTERIVEIAPGSSIEVVLDLPEPEPPPELAVVASPPEAQIAPEPERSTWWIWLVAGIGVAAVAGGVAIGLTVERPIDGGTEGFVLRGIEAR